MINQETREERNRRISRERWRANVEAGFCGRCGGDRGESTTLQCNKCREASRIASMKSYRKHNVERTAFFAKRYLDRKIAGICVSCGKVPAAEGIARCSVCNAKQNEAQIKHHLKKINEMKSLNG